MIRRAAALALLVWGEVVGAQTSPLVRLQDAGPGPGPQLLARELAEPHVLIPPPPPGSSERALLRRDSIYHHTVIVLGRDAAVEGRVEGDVVVVAGDLYVHPGAVVSGRLISFGGGVYQSTLATSGPAIVYRDFTYDIAAEPGGFALSYRQLVAQSRERAFQGPPGIGLPSYDRTNGLSLALGPDLGPFGGSILVQPRLTYRSQLGRLDPSVLVEDSLNRRTALRLWAGRGSFTNEGWIWSDPVNSLEYFVFGHDARNWFRATRAELRATRRWESPTTTLEPYVGLRIEHASSIRPGVDATSAPWALNGRHDIDDALRPNPSIDDTVSRSVLGGARFQWTLGDIAARLSAGAELGSPDITQLTVDGAIRFAMFGTQSLQFEAHGVASRSPTLRQRYAYVGGPGTLPTTDMLALGGNELVFVDSRYNVPLDRFGIAVLGSPVVSLREVLAGGAIGRWPTLRQAIGGRVAMDILYAEVLVDPVRHGGRFSVALSIAR